jgi:hypothetical protein
VKKLICWLRGHMLYVQVAASYPEGGGLQVGCHRCKKVLLIG